MNSKLGRGLIVAALHLAIAGGVGAKYYIDRETLPRIWVQAAGFDPEALIRGRYVRLGLKVSRQGEQKLVQPWSIVQARLAVANGKLVAVDDPKGTVRVTAGAVPAETTVGPVAFYIPPGAKDPTFRKSGEELWAEVTVPRRGLPRPIRLAVKEGGRFEPITF